MKSVLLICLVAAFAGIAGTTAGVMLSAFLGGSRRTLSFMLEFTAGMMTAVVCFDLLPEAFALQGWPVALLGVIVGVVFAIVVQHTVKYGGKKERGRELQNTGLIAAVGIAMHSFPEGIAIGSGFHLSPALGLSLSLVILLHSIPWGLAMAVPMRAGGDKMPKILGSAALSGIPMALGALLGSTLGGLTGPAVSVCLAIAAGALLYIAFGDLIPESKHGYHGRLSAVGGVLGVIFGILLTRGF